jgi:hypothetical protein
MPKVTDPRGKSDFSSNKGTLPWENEQLKPGAKDSIGSQSNTLDVFSGSVNIGKMGGFGGEKKTP